ncbi:MAG: TIGR03936 family radical SAM-associated protein [Clostridia bacterium]|nr:TIGR03936 family radical SAM-associated protein [Clostridia bacterium]
MTNPVIRLEFKKFGGLKYISHLDLQRAILRFIKRAGIPIRYTEGFNPHPKLVCALTLSVVNESDCELVDFYLARDPENPEVPIITPDTFVSRLESVLPKGLEIVSAYFPESDFADIDSSDYIITLFKNAEIDVAQRLSEILSEPLEIVKKGKAGERVVDIVPMVFSWEVLEEKGDACTLRATLSAKQNEYLNPDHFVKGLMTKCPEIDTWLVKRISINFKEVK